MLNDLKKGELIVFAAPSGAGKSSLIKEIISNNENIELSVSATTRSPREGETHGKDYFLLLIMSLMTLRKKTHLLRVLMFMDINTELLKLLLKRS